MMRGICFLLFVAGLGTAPAAVRFPRALSSHMVLQRDMPLHLWGWSDPGESVTVSLGGASATATGDALGKWSVYLPPQTASAKPVEIRVKSSNEIVLDDVLIGDVWFASGQSNMEMPLGGFPGSAVLKNGAEEIRRADHPDMRLLLVHKKASGYPVEDIQSERAWTRCTPETAAKFSAVAYFFAREIADAEHVPIGVIDSSWGGTPAEAWTSMPGLASDASLMPVFSAWAEMSNEQANALAEKQRDEEARAKGQKPPNRKWRPDFFSWSPAWLFNGMVAPFLNMPIKGVIWYQGESNASPDRAGLYARLFPALIADWRSQWKQGDFPFYFVQLANYQAGGGDNWPLIREAQRRALSFKNTGMAVTADVGDPGNIHPSDKQSVGHRLALWARAQAYSEKAVYSGPLFRQAAPEEGGMRIYFDDADGPLKASGKLDGFELAGTDGHFIPAEARIDGASVSVTNAQVKNPCYVRYAWSNSPVLSLFNAEGLPASPFTSETPAH